MDKSTDYYIKMIANYINDESNKLQSLNKKATTKLYGNILIAISLLTLTFLIYRQKKHNG